MSELNPPREGLPERALLQRVIAACDRYEHAWRSGQRPTVAEYLPAGSEPDRTAFLRELLALDLRLRRERGERPAPQEYRGVFPERTELIDSVFLSLIDEGVPGAVSVSGGADPDPHLHPEPEVLAAFGLGRLDPALQDEVERHVAGCTACCEALGAVADDWLAALVRQAGSGTGSGPGRELPRELREHARYRIVRWLGAGGMGVVYQAEHRLMGRAVALKVLDPRLTSQARAVERFRLEVTAAARLSHPNIVTAHDAEQAGDLHFLVMEYVEGTSLSHLVKQRGPLPLVHACNAARQVALGLQHAFEQGMVHRDIKPQNLMLTPKGQVKILDFGLARILTEGAGAGAGAALTLTEPGMMLGTPDFMAPEQARDPRGADIRADIYSLGCTLYFLLAGVPPFPRGTALEKILAHLQDAPRPLDRHRADIHIPAELVAIVARMMEKDPGRRYQTPVEVATALVPFAH
jgi:hypothetical protein